VTGISVPENDDAWIDPLAEERLAAGVFGSAAIARRFLDDFASTWQSRLDRLVRALDAPDAEDVYVALLSIRSTSEMAGAIPLAHLAKMLEADAQAGRLDECRAGLDELRRAGADTMRALSRGRGRG
jgi:hypothetical protein